MSSPKNAPGCPYAAAIMAGDEEGENTSQSSASHGTSTASSPPTTAPQQWLEVEAAKTKCPAFNNVACPFQSKNPEEVQAKLLELPESHLKQDGLFFKSLKQLHGTPTGSQMLKAFVKECPVQKTLLPPNFSFQDAMEEFSLAAIMAKLAEQREAKLLHGGNAAASAIDMANSRSRSSSPIRLSASTDTDANLSAASSDSSSSKKPLLSEALKTGTAASHTQAEEVHFVKNFIRGKIDRDLYGQLVADLYHVYMVLEDALMEHAPTYFPSLHFPNELHRTQALKEDVDFWHTSLPPPSKATQDYMDRIRYCQAHNPLLLLAHAYTRYLGDLSGGKILARVARRALNLAKDGEGLAFYEFPNIESAKLFKDRYRNCLNALDLTQEHISAVVHEANIAFGLNMRVFEELDVAGGVIGAKVRPLQAIYDVADGASVYAPEDPAAAECPFAKPSSSKGASLATTITTSTTTTKQGTCPWPFILLHDPSTGMQCWQTWLVMGLILMWTYRQFVVEV